MDLQSARNIDRYLEKFSLGYALRNEVEITCRQIISAARRQRMNKGDYLSKDKSRGPVTATMLKRLGETKKAAFDAIQGPIDLANRVRDITRDGRRSDPDGSRAVIELVRSDYAKKLSDQLDRIASGKAINLVFHGDADLQFPRWDVTICSILLKQFRIKRHEARRVNDTA